MPVTHKTKMTVAAHRGDCYNYHENTMPAFVGAVKAGADMIETDVRLTQDLVPVLIHDEKVDRTTDGVGRVKDFTLEEIRKLNAANVNYPAGIITVEEFFRWVKEDVRKKITLNMEIKEYHEPENEERCRFCVEEVIRLAQKYSLGDRILINSFDAYVLEYCYKKYGKKYMLHGFYPYSIMRLENTELNPDEYLYCACIFDVKNKASYDYLAARGIETWIGASVTSKMMLELAIGYGAKLVTTNNPKDAKRKIKEIKI